MNSRTVIKNMGAFILLLVFTAINGQDFLTVIDTNRINQNYLLNTTSIDSAEFSTRNPVNTGSTPHAIYDTTIFYKSTPGLKLIYIKD